jgi:hypothetical protein
MKPWDRVDQYVEAKKKAPKIKRKISKPTIYIPRLDRAFKPLGMNVYILEEDEVLLLVLRDRRRKEEK